jgi:hypothetical protein|nr:MAG TPA: hypothetical protein [Caudoviricetes sp.]
MRTRQYKVPTKHVTVDIKDAEFLDSTLYAIRAYLLDHPEEIIPFFLLGYDSYENWIKTHLDISVALATDGRSSYLRDYTIIGILSSIKNTYLKGLSKVLPKTFSTNRSEHSKLKLATELYITSNVVNSNLTSETIITMTNLGITLLKYLVIAHDANKLSYGFMSVKNKVNIIELMDKETTGKYDFKEYFDTRIERFLSELHTGIKESNPAFIDPLFGFTSSKNKFSSDILEILRDYLISKYLHSDSELATKIRSYMDISHNTMGFVVDLSEHARFIKVIEVLHRNFHQDLTEPVYRRLKTELFDQIRSFDYSTSKEKGVITVNISLKGLSTTLKYDILSGRTVKR